MTAGTAGFRGGEMTVLEGQDDWLFIGEYEGIDAQAVYTDPNHIPEATYERWRNTLTARREYFAERGITYLSVVVPDTCMVYPDKLPKGFTVASPTPYERLVEGLDAETQAQFVHPLQELIAGRDRRPTFQSTDSHWTDWGAYLGYRATIRALQPSLPTIRLLEEDGIEWSRRWSFGALGAVSVPERSEELDVATIKDSAVHRTANLMTHVRDAFTIEEQDRPDLPTAVIFRDSAMTSAAKFFSQSFRRVVYVSSANTIHYDLVERERPDVVIHEFGERRIVNQPYEPTLKDFAFIFGDLLLGDEAAVAAQRKARSHLDAGRAAEALAANDEALAATEHVNSRLLVFRSRVHQLLGDQEAALECLRHSTLLDPGDAFARFMFAQALRVSGRSAAAVAECERVLELDDRHLQYWSEAVASAIYAGAASRAVELAENMTLRLPDIAEAHYALACARTAAGQVVAAEEALRRALELSPGNDLFRRQLASILVRGARFEDAEELLVQLLDTTPGEPTLSATLAHVRSKKAQPAAERA